MLLQIWNFLLKTPLTEMALAPLFFNKSIHYWPFYSSLERFRKFLEKSDTQMHRCTDAQTDRRTHKATFNLRYNQI